MAIVVKKFGGTSVKDKIRIQNVASIIEKSYNENDSVVVVVSAQGDTTDLLIEKSKEISDVASNREMDILLSSGEIVSMALLCMELEYRNIPAVSLMGWQAGFLTDDNYSNAKILDIDTKRIVSELEQKKVVVIAGFQGMNEINDITTLGRGGSDTSAVAVASKLGADVCQIYTDVDGIYVADPRIIKNPKKLDYIGYNEMIELASAGAEVLHNRSVLMAKKFNMTIEVLSSLKNTKGTFVKEVNKVENFSITGITKNNNLIKVICLNINRNKIKIFQIINAFTENNIEVDVVTSPKKNELILVIDKKNKKIVGEILGEIGVLEIEYREDLAKITVVGDSLKSHPEILSKLYSILESNNIDIDMTVLSELSFSFFTKNYQMKNSIELLYNNFFN